MAPESKYSAAFKLEAIEKTNASLNRAVARELGVDEKRIREWREKESELNEVPEKTAKVHVDCPGPGARQPFYLSTSMNWRSGLGH